MPNGRRRIGPGSSATDPWVYDVTSTGRVVMVLALVMMILALAELVLTVLTVLIKLKALTLKKLSESFVDVLLLVFIPQTSLYKCKKCLAREIEFKPLREFQETFIWRRAVIKSDYVQRKT